MNEREWTLKDLFRAIGISFDLRKLFVAFVGLFLALVIYFFFAFLAEKAGGAGILFRTIGYILVYFIVAFVFGALARMIAVHLREQRRASFREVAQFLSKNLTTLLFIPLAFALIILLLLFIELLSSLIGAIPILGPLFYAATFFLQFCLSFVAVLCIAVAAIVLIIYPALIAIQEAGILEVLEELFRLAKQKGIFILAYEIMLHVLNIVVTSVLFVFASASVWLSAKIAQSTMGTRFDLLVGGSTEYGQSLFRLLTAVATVDIQSQDQIPALFSLAGLLFTLSLIFITCLLLAYPITFLNVGGVLIYLLVQEEELPPEEATDEESPSSSKKTEHPSK